MCLTKLLKATRFANRQKETFSNQDLLEVPQSINILVRTLVRSFKDGTVYV